MTNIEMGMSTTLLVGMLAGAVVHLVLLRMLRRRANPIVGAAFAAASVALTGPSPWWAAAAGFLIGHIASEVTNDFLVGKRPTRQHAYVLLMAMSILALGTMFTMWMFTTETARMVQDKHWRFEKGDAADQYVARVYVPCVNKDGGSSWTDPRLSALNRKSSYAADRCTKSTLEQAKQESGDAFAQQVSKSIARWNDGHLGTKEETAKLDGLARKLAQ